VAKKTSGRPRKRGFRTLKGVSRAERLFIEGTNSFAIEIVSAALRQVKRVEHLGEKHRQGGPLEFLVGGCYYAKIHDGGPDWGLRFAVTLLSPKSAASRTRLNLITQEEQKR
jgi:hypothetical protein